MRTISCILCHRTIAAPDLPPYLYINHLSIKCFQENIFCNKIILESHHDVVYDVDWIVQRTFALQHPLLASSSTSPPHSSLALAVSSNTNIQNFLEDRYNEDSFGFQGSASRLQQTLPPSVSITPVYKRKPSEVFSDDAKKAKEDIADANNHGITIFNETSITPKVGLLLNIFV